MNATAVTSIEQLTPVVGTSHQARNLVSVFKIEMLVDRVQFSIPELLEEKCHCEK